MERLKHRHLSIDQAAARAVGAGPVESRTVDLVFTTGRGVARFDWWTGTRYIEELSLHPKHVRMERLNCGAPLLAVHNQFSLDGVIGVTESATLAGDKGTARVRFAKTDEGDKALGMVRDGIIRNISVGYLVHRYEKTEPKDGALAVWRAIDWEPAEISLVPVPADAGAQVIRGGLLEVAAEENNPQHRKEETMNARTAQPEEMQRLGQLTDGPERRAEILQRGMHAGLSVQFVERLISSNMTLERACREMVDEQARSSAPAAPINPSRHNGAPPAHVAREAMAEMIFARLGGPAPSEHARQYGNQRLVDMARELLEINGVRTTGLGPSEIFSRSFASTSDFPYILENVANKVMLRGYESYPAGIKRVSRRVLARDFRPMSRLQFGEAPQLQKVLEGGEFKRGKMLEQKNSFSVETFGRIYSITRQALVNDDIGAFDQIGPKLGKAAAEFEHAQLASLVTGNPTMGDGVALFHATHANLGTGTGSALSTGSLSTAVTAMRLQKGLDGVTPINVVPKWLIVPAALEYTGRQLLAQITPAEASKVNPYAGELELVVDSRLDASSSTAWYLAAASETIDTIEYANLEDSRGPILEMQAGFVIDGIDVKVREDFGCGVVEFRGLYKANGA